MKRRAFRGGVITILLTVLVLGALPFRARAAESLLGDLNGDGRINTLDYAMLKLHVLREHPLSPEGLKMADVNRDGGVNAADYGLLKLHVLRRYDIHVDNHLFLQYKDGGNCETLRGKVSILFVFVSDSESTWDDASRENAEVRLQEEMSRMMRMAKDNAVDLTLYYGEWDLAVETDVEAYNADSWTKPVAAALGFESLHHLQMALERDWEVASAPIVFVVNKAGRAAAHSQYVEAGAEFLTLYGSDLTPFCHELLHLYGARDLYFPMTVSDAATAYLKDSIMAMGHRMDDLTAYTVGWQETPSENARAFLKATAHLAADDLEKAVQEEQFTGYGEKRYANGDLYVGNLELGIPKGEGEYFFATGAVYRGTFENGTFWGNGVMTWPNGDRYEGDFVQGVRSGQGVYSWSNGDRYEGGFLDGRIHGQGVYYYANGAVKTGTWIHGVYQD